MEFPLDPPDTRLVDRDWPLRVPPPSHRHAAPSGPWPWQDLDDPIPPTTRSTEDPIPSTTQSMDDTSHESLTPPVSFRWDEYPECLFPNWKTDQVERSKMKATLQESKESMIYHIDVDEDGRFIDQGSHLVQSENKEQFDKAMEETNSPKRCRVRAFFLENLSTSVMQMIGTKYKVEPFFWTSSVNWIPARYQEKDDMSMQYEDHITITLKFPRPARLANIPMTASHPALDGKIDTQRPLPLIIKDDPKRNRVLILDLIALHMLRTPADSTIISYHPISDWKTTPAKSLYSRVYLVGQSVYWQKIFAHTDDPTFVLLATLWYALYSWDESFEMLWEHICQIELRALNTDYIVDVTHELHKIRAHLLQYASLLEDFKRTIIFIEKTKNPVMEDPTYESKHKDSEKLLLKECKNLLMQIERLQMSREMWDKRLQNLMQLVFSTVNITDSQQMKGLTQATVKDSAAMKQIAYLTMVFLPASFAAGVFGMNIQEINPTAFGTLRNYFAATVPLTVVTSWVVIALQGKWNREGEEISIWKRLGWPITFVQQTVRGRAQEGQDPYNTL